MGKATPQRHRGANATVRGHAVPVLDAGLGLGELDPAHVRHQLAAMIATTAQAPRETRWAWPGLRTPDRRAREILSAGPAWWQDRAPEQADRKYPLSPDTPKHRRAEAPAGTSVSRAPGRRAPGSGGPAWRILRSRDAPPRGI